MISANSGAPSGFSGFTLCEILIVQVLTLILISFLLQYYQQATFQQNKTQHMLSTLNATTMALDGLVAEIAQAGFIGCAKLSKDFPLLIDTENNNANEIATAHIDKPRDPTESNSKPPALQPLQLTRSNELQLNYASLENKIILKNLTANTLTVQSAWQFAVNDKILLADCEHAEIKNITTVQKHHTLQILTFNKPLVFTYQENMLLAPFIHAHFFIAKTARYDSNHQPIYGFFAKKNNENAQEILPAIKSIAYLFTVCAAWQCEEVTKEHVTDWQEVKGVTLKLTMSTLPKAWYRYATIGG